jgi:hypothetical protein
MTKGMKMLRTLISAFLPMFIPIGCMLLIIENQNMTIIGVPIIWLVYGLLVISTFWNIYIFASDILPSGMAVTNLKKTMNKLSIKKIHTYNIPHNNPFAGVLKLTYPEIDIEYITTIDQVKNGYILIPPTGSKFGPYDNSAVVIEGDFRSDDVLNNLLDTGEIIKFVCATFKTTASSKYWQHLSHVSSFRDLILKDLTDYDWKYLGIARILDATRLNG